MSSSDPCLSGGFSYRWFDSRLSPGFRGCTTQCVESRLCNCCSCDGLVTSRVVQNPQHCYLCTCVELIPKAVERCVGSVTRIRTMVTVITYVTEMMCSREDSLGPGLLTSRSRKTASCPSAPPAWLGGGSSPPPSPTGTSPFSLLVLADSSRLPSYPIPPS